MSEFRYVIEQTGPAGQQSRSAETIRGGTCVVGRGGASTIRSQLPRVAVEHARFSLSDQGLIVERMPDGGDLQVDGQELVRAVLRPGQTVVLGGLSLSVDRDGDAWVLKELRSVSETPATAGHGVDAFSAAHQFSALPRISLMICIAVVLVSVVYPLASKRYEIWSAGPMARPHQFISHDCAACHGKPFQKIADTNCEQCHSMSAHSSRLPAIEHAVRRQQGACTDCHNDHRGGDGAIVKDSQLCASCHANLKSVTAEADRRSFTSFASHPQFSVAIALAFGEERTQRVSLDDHQALVDRSGLKLNHALHLAPGLRGPDGPITMQCNDCHQLTTDLRDIRPVSFENHCQSCHPLTFDERLPLLEVPHGSADAAFNFVFAEYAKLALKAAEETPEEKNIIPRFRGIKVASSQESVARTREAVFAEARETEAMLFERTGCYLCHAVERRESAADDQAQFRIVPPHVPARWLPGARFDHGAHKELTCESCHAAAESRRTEDVLLPTIETCRDCHAQEPRRGMVQSDCVMCHSYHDETLLTADKVRSRDVLRGGFER